MMMRMMKKNCQKNKKIKRIKKANKPPVKIKKREKKKNINK